MEIRAWQRDSRDRTVLQPAPPAAFDMLPTIAYTDNPSTSFAAKFVHASTNKNRCSINCVLWTPTGRRLITGSQSGEFTLWDGQSFNFQLVLQVCSVHFTCLFHFEDICSDLSNCILNILVVGCPFIQAHDQAIRSMVWSHNENWMVTGDDGGSIKYWENSMASVKAKKSAHKESVRDLSFSKTDLKLCSCSDDKTVKVWDFARCQEERSLSGHSWDVKSVDWHPTKSLLVSGGKDNLVKLWDAKSGRELSSFHGHKNTVLRVKWNQNGNWVLTASKDQIIKLYDIRVMKELESFRGHQKDVTALAWHPFHEDYFVSGSFDGSIFHWLVGHDTPQVEITGAHINSVWDLAWHPIGNILCSGSNDHTTKFWCRNRPGDTPGDNTGYNQGFGEHNPPLVGLVPSNFPIPGLPRIEGIIPGIEVAMPLSIPSIGTSHQGEQQQQSFPVSMPVFVGAPPLPPGPHPSLLAPGQSYQQFSHHMPPQQQQHQPYQQQIPSLQVPPSNMPQMRPPPSHLSFPPHSHSRPPPMSGSSPMPSMSNSPQLPPMHGQMGMQGSMNQMVQPMPQGHMMGVNQMHSGSVPANGLQQPPYGGYASGMPNIQGPSGPSVPGQMYPPMGGPYNRGQPVQMSMVPALNPHQAGNQNWTGMRQVGMHMTLSPGMPPPPPPPPVPQQQHGSNSQ
ncbi:hypothetical protein MKW92_035909 [Papaver armeniacum]|nr:hypothetical protein MKW92_035909 [Papaver armeniacum]